MKRSLFVVGLLACNAEPSPAPIYTGVCDGVIEAFPILASPHREEGAAEAWNSNPPTSGPHSPAWAAWDRHHPTLDRVHWVHNLEHGGVVLAYRCEVACPEVVEALAQLVRDTPTESLCTAPVAHRLLVVADPLLPEGVQVAAVAWGTSFVAGCVDAPNLRAFIDEHLGRGPEATCANGLAFVSEPL